jgi:glutathione reductase (NADPH)
VASRCAQRDWKVGIADPRPFGGNCALRGCNPKKVLVRAAELTDWSRRMEGKGVRSGDAQIEWSELIRFKRTFTEPVTESKEESFDKAGIRQFHGAPRFTGPNSVEIDGHAVEARYLLIATGAVPMELPIEGCEHLTTSDDFLELEELPGRVVFVGGGYISFEFAHVAARAGASVTILEMAERPLAQFEPELVERLVDRSRSVGIDVRTNARVDLIQRQSDGTFAVHVAKAASETPIPADLIVHGAGRVPNVASLDIEAAGVEADKRGIRVNQFLQSVSNPAVYAAGDVAARDAPPLTPVANEDGRAVATNLLEGNRARPDYGPVPTAVFSVPALAAVGLTEREAIDQGLSFNVKSGDWAKFNSMRKVGETHAAYKILVENGSDRLLGAHLMGHDAAESINVFALAMRLQLKATDVKSVLFTFPTFAADIRSML